MAYEIETALIGLTGVLLGGVVSGAATYLVQRGERDKHMRERSWDFRREAYTKILGSLDRASSLMDRMNEGYRENPHAYDPSREREELSAHFVTQYHEARAAIHANRLMLSKDFLREFDHLQSGLAQAESDNLAPPESAKIVAEEIQTSVKRLEEIGRRELGVKG